MLLREFIQKLGLPITNMRVYEQAFVHKSYLNENVTDADKYYERLEFLGDSVLSSTTSFYLFSKNINLRDMVLYKHYLAGNNTIAKVSIKLGLDRFILVSKGLEVGKKTNFSLLADVFESFCAAIFLNGNWNDAYEFIKKNLLETHFNSKILELDFKTILQEKAVKHFNELPKYNVVKKNHDFLAICQLSKYQTNALGSNKKDATKNAAHLMLVKLKQIIR